MLCSQMIAYENRTLSTSSPESVCLRARLSSLATRHFLSPLESVLTPNEPVSPLESVLTRNTPGWASSLVGVALGQQSFPSSLTTTHYHVSALYSVISSPFVASSKLKCFVFSQIQSLFAKCPGWGYLVASFSVLSFFLSAAGHERATLAAADCPGSVGDCRRLL